MSNMVDFVSVLILGVHAAMKLCVCVCVYMCMLLSGHTSSDEVQGNIDINIH